MATKKRLTTAIAAAAVLVAAAAFALSRGRSRSAADGTVRFVTVPVGRGDVVATVAASGTLEPDELVDVGSQVSGKIVAFGLDGTGAEVDYCSAVTNGMVLARIDDVTYLADLDVAKAQFASAKAAVASAGATLAKARIDAEHARRDFERARAVGVGIALSQSDYDAFEAAAEHPANSSGA